ncbi:MAG: enoyl-CoA hydratase/isomerase family protein [Phycisphaerales bacterium]|nr:enoyl-CoA hydratase/isomerase family protein [Phycisphaerales bacterium]
MTLATLDIRGRVATLALNRPDQRNALSIDLIASLRHRVGELARDAGSPDAPRVLILTGHGKAFCAGMDLRAVLDDPAAPPRLLGALAELTLEIRALPHVVIAQVQGAAIGGGCGLTCVADISLTHDSAKVGFPEVDLGVCPAVVAPWVVRKVGGGKARQILLRGGLLAGAEAAALGLMDRSLPGPNELDSAVRELADRIAAGGRLALRATKELLNRLDGSLDADVVREGARLSAEVVASPEAQASLRARFESS